MSTMKPCSLDKLSIRALQARCIIGTKPEERTKKQDVVIDIELEADLSAACRSDRLDDTVNYQALKGEVLGMIEASGFFLIEHLAQEVADICLRHRRVRRVRVLVQKPGALAPARTVGVEIAREQGAGG